MKWIYIDAENVVTPVVTSGYAEVITERCDMCKKDFAEDIYKTYDDGGDYLICLDCVTNKCSSEKHLKSTLKTLDKIL